MNNGRCRLRLFSGFWAALTAIEVITELRDEQCGNTLYLGNGAFNTLVQYETIAQMGFIPGLSYSMYRHFSDLKVEETLVGILDFRA